MEEGLPSSVAVDGPGSWTYVLKGRGTPVVGDGKVYAMGYEGEGKELQEKIVCLDAKSGRLLWEHSFTDFISDIIYHRFAISSPTIDPHSGNVFCMSTAGLLSSFTADGTLRWQKSLMSEYGRLTFPNGRTGAPLLVDGLCIVHVISSAWGAHGPARDRFLAFDLTSGESIWSSTPGGPPKDSSFSFPYVAEEHGKLVMYAGLGGGYLVCVDVRTGDPIWRFKMAIGGVNCSPVVYKDHVIAIHGKENIDTSVIGRMVSVKRGSHPGKGEKGPKELGIKTHEAWRNDLVAFTSSPTLVGDRVYETDAHGELSCIDAASGEIVWHEKLAPDQIHASPAYGDGKLYVPMNNGTFFIIEPGEEGPKVLQKLPPPDTESFLGKLGAVEQPLGTTVQEQVRASELSSPLLLIMSNASLVSDDFPKLLRLGSFWQTGSLGGSPLDMILLDELLLPGRAHQVFNAKPLPVKSAEAEATLASLREALEQRGSNTMKMLGIRFKVRRNRDPCPVAVVLRSPLWCCRLAWFRSRLRDCRSPLPFAVSALTP